MEPARQSTMNHPQTQGNILPGAPWEPPSAYHLRSKAHWRSDFRQLKGQGERQGKEEESEGNVPTNGGGGRGQGHGSREGQSTATRLAAAAWPRSRPSGWLPCEAAAVPSHRTLTAAARGRTRLEHAGGGGTSGVAEGRPRRIGQPGCSAARASQ